MCAASDLEKLKPLLRCIHACIPLTVFCPKLPDASHPSRVVWEPTKCPTCTMWVDHLKRSSLSSLERDCLRSFLKTIFSRGRKLGIPKKDNGPSFHPLSSRRRPHLSGHHQRSPRVGLTLDHSWNAGMPYAPNYIFNAIWQLLLHPRAMTRSFCTQPQTYL